MLEEGAEYSRAVSLTSKYMLEGWVLTDGVCSVPDCHVPLLRSKDFSIRFCVVHDEEPTVSAAGTGNGTSTPRSENDKSSGTPAAPVFETPTAALEAKLAATVVAEKEEVYKDDDEKDDGDKDDNKIQELGEEAMDSAVANDEEVQKRREQSAKASQLIGQKLLQGWAMVNEVCPSDGCYGIPLLRNRSKQLYCVICQKTYMKESDFDPSKYSLVNNETATAVVTPTTVTTTTVTPATVTPTTVTPTTVTPTTERKGQPLTPPAEKEHPPLPPGELAEDGAGKRNGGTSEEDEEALRKSEVSIVAFFSWGALFENRQDGCTLHTQPAIRRQPWALVPYSSCSLTQPQRTMFTASVHLSLRVRTGHH
ncbi:hypothetical protein BC937DRAFT_90745 [Endogone sp. FLAS-F59071]|nr:hypothetical protein BC937DRAFT_90745 [Endogone sp. FLAS-F59071]|eukprot:RUS21985.1 hypothetical protein BC937DRAFT_90745 [Endogone sp. FLAS-F59071]